MPVNQNLFNEFCAQWRHRQLQALCKFLGAVGFCARFIGFGAGKALPAPHPRNLWPPCY
jgi:hypothetical protein